MTTTTFQSETLDESLSLEDLSAIHGGGKIWDWIKDKAEDKSVWTGFTSWNQNRLNDSSDTETIQALVNSLLQEL